MSHKDGRVVLSAWVDPVLRDYAREAARLSGLEFSHWVARAVRQTMEGKLQTRSWEGKDGKKQYSTEVVAHRVHLIQLGEQQAAEPRRETAKAVEGSQEVAEDDIPFYGGVWIARGVADGQGSVL